MSAKILSCLAAGAICLGLSDMAAAGTSLRLTKADCRRLVEHLPDEDVVYREGRDVRGRPVVPADLPGRPKLPLPEDYVFDIEVRPFDLVERRGLTEESEIIADALAENPTTLTLGRARVTRDGQAYFNGVALHDEAQRRLALGCREALEAEPE